MKSKGLEMTLWATWVQAWIAWAWIWLPWFAALIAGFVSVVQGVLAIWESRTFRTWVRNWYNNRRALRILRLRRELQAAEDQSEF